MKKIIFIIIGFLFYNTANSQIAIGKSAVTNSSVSLEFGNDKKGLVLPWVTNTSAVDLLGAVNGTFVYDLSDHKIKVKINNLWKDFSINDGGTANDALQSTKTENPTARVIIGANPGNVNTPGVLVLSDTDKAMVLPTVENPYLNIANPTPGTIAYNSLTKQVEFFNGTVWTFWKAE